MIRLKAALRGPGRFTEHATSMRLILWHREKRLPLETATAGRPTSNEAT